MMPEHFCPMCGVAHGGEEVHEEVEVEEEPVSADNGAGSSEAGIAETAIEAVRDVAIAAVQADAIADVADATAEVAEAQAEAVEAEAEAVADVAEEHSEEVIAEEAGEDEDEEEPEEVAEPEEHHPAEAEEVTVPPQPEEEERHRSQGRSTSAFHARRMRR